MTPTEYRSLREELGLTQQQLSERLGVSRATINAREADRVSISNEAEIALRSLAAAAQKSSP